MLAAERATWQNWRILMMLSLVFLAGAMAGALGMRAGLHDILHRSVLAWREDRAPLSYERLTKDLNLTPQQADQLKSILDDMVRYNQDLQTQIEDVRATGKNRIRQILTPEQREKFERIANQLPDR